MRAQDTVLEAPRSATRRPRRFSPALALRRAQCLATMTSTPRSSTVWPAWCAGCRSWRPTRQRCRLGAGREGSCSPALVTASPTPAVIGGLSDESSSLGRLVEPAGRARPSMGVKFDEEFLDAASRSSVTFGFAVPAAGFGVADELFLGAQPGLEAGCVVGGGDELRAGQVEVALAGRPPTGWPSWSASISWRKPADGRASSSFTLGAGCGPTGPTSG